MPGERNTVQIGKVAVHSFEQFGTTNYILHAPDDPYTVPGWDTKEEMIGDLLNIICHLEAEPE